MKSYVTGFVVLVAAAGVAAGCAAGTTDLDPSESYLSATPAESDAGDNDNSVKIPPASNPSTPDDDEDAGASSADAGTDSGTQNTPGVSCAASNACSTSTDLGSVSGDTGSGVKTAQGSTSQWFKIRVTEDDTGLFDSVKLKLTAALTSPAGSNFDLFLYVPDTDSLACVIVSQQSTSTGVNDSASVQFGEGGILPNGSDDSRTVTVEVRQVSGTCDPSKKWTLTLSGNK